MILSFYTEDYTDLQIVKYSDEYIIVADPLGTIRLFKM